MADKYIIEGATYNGDGTASNEAASAGAAGAWNHIDIMTGTAVGYGSLAAGDTVYVRSKTSAGADVTVTIGAAKTVGSTLATATSPVRWIIDGGTKWSGVNGIVKFTKSGNYVVTLQAHNIFECDVQDALVFEQTGGGTPFQWAILTLQACTLKRALIDYSACSGAEPGFIDFRNGTVWVVLDDVHIKVAKWGRSGVLYVSSTANNLVLANNLKIEKTAVEGSAAYSPLFYVNSNGNIIIMNGGRIYGAGTASNCSLIPQAATVPMMVTLNGFQIPKAMPIVNDYSIATIPVADVFASDGDIGTEAVRHWGYVSSRRDNNYPYLNATLPNSVATGWAWRFISMFANELRPMKFPISSKIYTDTAAALTITANMSIVDSYAANLNTSNLWIEVSYVDNTTGDRVSATSRTLASNALGTGPAWSASSYGPATLLSKSVALTTPTTVRKDSLIVVTLCASKAAASVSELLLACPDVQLT